jgi:ATP-dependent DNA helicase RecG
VIILKRDEFLNMVETTDTEYKVSVEMSKPKSWLKTVSAFANTLGGTIYFGIDDNKNIIGIEQVQKDLEKISEIIKNKIDPFVWFSLDSVDIDGKIIIKLIVNSGTITPYYYSNEGNKIAYIRMGNESVIAPTHIINELILRGQKLTYDAMSSNIPFNKLSFTLFKATYFQKTRIELDEKTDYKSFGLVDENNMLTYAGVLLSDQCPLLQSRIFCTRWNGKEKGSIYEDALDDKEFSGNLISLLENGFNFVKTHNKKAWKKTETSREEYFDYSERAITEALVNGLIHRSYNIIGSEIHIDIYDDRLEIVSPGGMYDGSFIQDEDIFHIASIRRNPVLADIFQRLRYMEKRGSGFKKIFESAGNENVSFYSTKTIFVVIMKNMNYIESDNKKVPIKSADKKVPIKSADKKNSEKIETIINYLKEHEYITSSIVEEITGVKDTRAKQYLRSLVEKGFIIPEGNNRNRRYKKKI